MPTKASVALVFSQGLKFRVDLDQSSSENSEPEQIGLGRPSPGLSPGPGSESEL